MKPFQLRIGQAKLRFVQFEINPHPNSMSKKPMTSRSKISKIHAINSGEWPRILLVGPLPPPLGGMANQCEQLMRLLKAEGADVELVCSNSPYRPNFVARVPVLRAVFRLLYYIGDLWSAAGRAEVMHILANSGWAWHLVALPALCVARLRTVATIVNYRGGLADDFFSTGPRHVLKALSYATLRITPSAYLFRVFAKHGLDAEIIPNIVDLSRFYVSAPRIGLLTPHIIVTRNLEPIYDIPTALRAFLRVIKVYPQARLTVAGSGPELAKLERLCIEMGIEKSVAFPGGIQNSKICELYASADFVINPSTADNMPNSILEALACGVPIISTCVGGIPDLVEHGVTALLVEVGDDEAMAQQILDLMTYPDRADALRAAGQEEVQRYDWSNIRDQWRSAYQRARQAQLLLSGQVV